MGNYFFFNFRIKSQLSMYINKESLRFDSSHLYTATTWKFSDIYLLSKGQNINNYPFCITTVNKGT